MNRLDNRGFSLIELSVVVLVFGLIVAFSIPTFRSYRESQDLKLAVANITGQMRLAREKAIATGQQQTMHFSYNFMESDYHIHNGTVVDPKWKLPKGVTYYWGTGTVSEFFLLKTGRSQQSGMVILEDSRGNRDTISVQASGLVLAK